MKSPVFLNEDELKKWTEDERVRVGGGMGETYPTHYPCMIIYDGSSQQIDTVYYSEFQKRRYVVFGD